MFELLHGIEYDRNVEIGDDICNVYTSFKYSDGGTEKVERVIRYKDTVLCRDTHVYAEYADQFYPALSGSDKEYFASYMQLAEQGAIWREILEVFEISSSIYHWESGVYIAHQAWNNLISHNINFQNIYAEKKKQGYGINFVEHNERRGWIEITSSDYRG